MSKKKNNELLNELKLVSDVEIISKQYRHFIAILYKDSDIYNYDDIIFNLNQFKYYAYIEHQPEKEESKIHTHLFISLDSATSINAISKRIGIPENYIQYVKSVRSSIRYLTHIDYPEKIQYPIEACNVSGAFWRKFRKQFEDLKSESDVIEDIYKWIDNFQYDDYHEKLKNLIIYINLNCYDTIFKRYRPEFIDYLKSTM